MPGLGCREDHPPILTVSAIFALGAAFSNALYVATQHIASTSGGVGKASGLRLVAYLIRSPLWLFGWGVAVGGFVFQAAALNNGQLSIVQALLVTELVFGLLLIVLMIFRPHGLLSNQGRREEEPTPSLVAAEEEAAAST